MSNLSLNTKKERFSIGYIEAIASIAGFSISEVKVDFDSIDLTIDQYDCNDDIIYESLRVQMKCTSTHIPKNGFISFPLTLKNYNDLRKKTMNPRILVVFHVPDNIDEWMIFHDNRAEFRHLGYWTSIRNAADTDNTGKVTIKIPTINVFTVNSLKHIMNMLANGERP